MLVIIVLWFLAAQDMPEPLRAALNARDFTRAKFEFRRHSRAGEEYALRCAQVFLAGDDVAILSQLRGASGDITRSRNMWQDQQHWVNMGHSIATTVNGEVDSPPNLRQVGFVLPHPGDGPVSYEAKKDGSLLLVTARLENKLTEFRYRLDPAQGFAFREFELWVNGECRRRNIIENENVSGWWFPSRVTEFSGDDDRPLSIYEFFSIEIESPNCPHRLSPEHIGVQVGTNVDVRRTRGSLSEQLMWDGSGLATAAEVRDRVASGELTLGPDYEDEMRRLASGEDIDQAIIADAKRVLIDHWGEPLVSGTGRSKQVWEDLVADFIREHALGREQIHRAWTIHADCSSMLRHWVRRNPAESLATSQSAADWTREYERRRESIENKTLLPRLKSLLTRKQLLDR